MIDTAALKAEMYRNDVSGAKLAKFLGIAPKTFYDKMKKGVFDSDEIEQMIVYLDIEKPMDIFFVKRVT